MKERARPRIGRPPRTDSPARVTVRLPGVVRGRLRRLAANEGRAEGDVIASALEFYRKRRKPGG